jgi:hypothetical protein
MKSQELDQITHETPDTTGYGPMLDDAVRLTDALCHDEALLEALGRILTRGRDAEVAEKLLADRLAAIESHIRLLSGVTGMALGFVRHVPALERRPLAAYLYVIDEAARMLKDATGATGDLNPPDADNTREAEHA